MRQAPAHYIRGNAKARIPERVICFDTEAWRKDSPIGEDQVWELAVASFNHWTSKGVLHQSVNRYARPESMWADICAFTRAKRRTVVYAHNIGYDIRISRALDILPDLGWTMVDARLDDRSSWFKWSKDTATLLLCDSVSIFNTGLDQVGHALGIDKLPLPNHTDRDNLFLRCERDVEILTTAIIKYFKWLRTGVAGNWQMTGAGQSWAHWRHSHYTHKVLIHDDSDALAAERKAMWAGRCEAWTWGRDDHERVYEYDYQNAYPRIARETDLPARYCGHTRNITSDKLVALSDRFCILADVEITTGQPIVPTHHNEHIVWPTGSFRTMLWNPEIELVRRHGATIRVHQAWYYTKQPVLKQWGEWILDQIHDKTGKVPDWLKLVLKNWSRALIGRFSMKYHAWDQIAESDQSTVTVSDYMDMDTGEHSKLMQLGHNIYLQTGEREGNDACPQVTGYIMSVARVKLWRLTQIAGNDHTLYMDTDSILVDATGKEALESNAHLPLLDGLVHKDTSHGYRIYGPRAIILDRSRKVAGLPKNSQEIDNHKFFGQVWEGISHALETNTHDKVRIRYRSHSLEPNPSRRYLHADGTTSAYVLPGGTPQNGYDLGHSWVSLALETRLPRDVLAMVPRDQRNVPTALDKHLRYSVRTG